MKIYSTFSYFILGVGAAWPVLGQTQAQVQAQTQANVVTNNGTVNPLIVKTAQKQSPNLVPNFAPVETAVPKINEKYLTVEELKELRRQLRQQN